MKSNILRTAALAAAVVAGGFACPRSEANPRINGEVSGLTRPQICAGSEWKTYKFAERKSGDLLMDVYIDRRVSVKGPRPVILYMFGGGWEGGKRTSSTISATGMFERFTDLGYAAVSIDYRLGFKIAREEKMFSPDRSIGQCLAQPECFNDDKVWAAVCRAARWGVEDLYAATRYLTDHAAELGIDPTRIIISGGSAGAINAVMGEYLLCNNDPLAKALPEGFDYAAVLAFGGGVWDNNRFPLSWGREPCPMMMFHGDADPVVPFATTVYAHGAAHGVKDIARYLRDRHWAYALYNYEWQDHTMSFLPMAIAVDDMLSFIKRAVTDGEKVQIDITQHINGEIYNGMKMLEEMEKKRGLKADR